jgi:hypothetical protein
MLMMMMMLRYLYLVERRSVAEEQFCVFPETQPHFSETTK